MENEKINCVNFQKVHLNQQSRNYLNPLEGGNFKVKP